MSTPEEHDEILRLLRENRELAEQNNKLLNTLYRHNVIGFTIRIVWLVILLGLPFALYFAVLEPYFATVGADFNVFKAGIDEIPGLKILELYLPHSE